MACGLKATPTGFEGMPDDGPQPNDDAQETEEDEIIPGTCLIVERGRS